MGERVFGVFGGADEDRDCVWGDVEVRRKGGSRRERGE